MRKRDKEREALKRAKIMRARLASLRAYFNTYAEQQGWEAYSDDTFLDDALYAIGISLDPKKYSFGDGYRDFLKLIGRRMVERYNINTLD